MTTETVIEQATIRIAGFGLYTRKGNELPQKKRDCRNPEKTS
jgi:hypothetical protein